MGSLTDEDGTKLYTTDDRIVPPNINPNPKEFPVDTVITWQLDDTGSERTGRIVGYRNGESVVNIVDTVSQANQFFLVDRVFVNAVLGAEGVVCVSIRSPTETNDNHLKGVHPNPDTHPLGSYIVYQVNGVGVENTGKLVAYNSDNTVVIRDGITDQDELFDVTTVYLIEETRINPIDHPIGTRMLVDRVEMMASGAPAHDITILNWKTDGSELQARVNVEGGTVAWHKPESYYFWHLLDEQGQKIEENAVNDIDPTTATPLVHPVGTHLKIKSGLMKEDDEVVVVRWGRDANGRADDEVRLYSIDRRRDEWTKTDIFTIVGVLPPIHPIEQDYPVGTQIIIADPKTDTPRLYRSVEIVAWDVVDGQSRLSIRNVGLDPVTSTADNEWWSPSEIKVIKITPKPRKDTLKNSTITEEIDERFKSRPGDLVVNTLPMTDADAFFWHLREAKQLATKLGYTIEHRFK